MLEENLKLQRLNLKQRSTEEILEVVRAAIKHVCKCKEARVGSNYSLQVTPCPNPIASTPYTNIILRLFIYQYYRLYTSIVLEMESSPTLPSFFRDGDWHHDDHHDHNHYHLDRCGMSCLLGTTCSDYADGLQAKLEDSSHFLCF